MLLAACGGTSRAGLTTNYPATGLLLLSLRDGSLQGSASIGSDPVAVIVSDDGRIAFVADSAPGDVYAIRLPTLSLAWKRHLGGAPFGLLIHGGSLFVSLFDTATVEELDPSDGHVVATRPTLRQPASLAVDAFGNLVVAADGEFGITVVGGDVWSADYKQRILIDITRQRHVALPVDVSPFWLSAGANQTLLIAAEGDNEDADPGAVLAYSPIDGSFQTLARPKDPDQVIESRSTVLIAAHGEREVLSINNGRTSAWAPGAAAVAFAPDAPLGLLAVVVNSHE